MYGWRDMNPVSGLTSPPVGFSQYSLALLFPQKAHMEISTQISQKHINTRHNPTYRPALHTASPPLWYATKLGQKKKNVCESPCTKGTNHKPLLVTRTCYLMLNPPLPFTNPNRIRHLMTHVIHLQVQIFIISTWEQKQTRTGKATDSDQIPRLIHLMMGIKVQTRLNRDGITYWNHTLRDCPLGAVKMRMTLRAKLVCG